MNNKLQPTIDQLIPYLVLGIAIALAVGLFIVLTHVIFWGVIIGGLIWLGLVIKNALFPSSSSPDSNEGRVIEHDDDND